MGGLGNGFPMGAVICSREVSDRLGGYFSTFGGNPVACAIGMSVLEVIKNEKLISSANRVGKHLQKSLINPPMCFNMENCQVLVSALEDILTALNQNPSKIAIETIEPELEKPANKRIRLEDLESEERSDEESVEYDILCEMD